MADSDSSFYTLRFDSVTQTLQYGIGNDWVDMPTSGGAVGVANSIQRTDGVGAFVGDESFQFASNILTFKSDGMSINMRDSDDDVYGSIAAYPASDPSNGVYLSAGQAGGVVALSTLNNRWTFNDDGSTNPPLLSSDPVSPTAGAMWYRTDTHEWRGYNGSAFGSFDFTTD